MTQKRNDQFQLLSRKNKGKTLLPHYIEKLNTALGVSLCARDFLNLEESDLISLEFRKIYNSQLKSRHKILNINNSSEIENQLSEMLEFFINSHNAFLITSYSEYCGITLLELNQCIRSFKEIIEIDGDSIALYVKERNSGILIDLFEDYVDGNSTWFYDFCYW